jgi:hypothetical protein
MFGRGTPLCVGLSICYGLFEFGILEILRRVSSMAEHGGSAEHRLGPSGLGTVVMEVGGDIGALVLYTPAEMDGDEIEISRDDEPGARRTHSQVRPRHLGAVTKYAAVYPGLAAGPYTLWRDEGTPAASVTIVGGQITNCRWTD